MTTAISNTATPLFLSAHHLLDHWQGHRKLTRRVIESFPDDKFFDHTLGGMRSFADMMKEILDISAPGVKGIATGEWSASDGSWSHNAKEVAASEKAFLDLWDKATEEINAYWLLISEDRFQESVLAFGQYEGTVYNTILYFIDNEVHHRAQGTVYLRSLGIEPPAFWNRD